MKPPKFRLPPFIVHRRRHRLSKCSTARSPMRPPGSAHPLPSPSSSLHDAPAPSERQKDEEEDLEAGGAGEVGKQGDWVEKLCRICHLGSGDGEPDELELIELGCACRGELGRSHRPCAEAWFRIRGNRCCEICGVTAKNIKGEDVVSFMESWHGRRVGGSNSADGSSCWWNQPFCNFLILCFVLVFVLPWFFHLSVL